MPRNFRAGEIVARCQLYVAGVAFKDAHRVTRPFCKRGVIGEVLAACGRRAAMGVDNEIESEGLRRLHHAQLIAIECLDHDRRLIDPFHRVRDSYGRHCGAALPGRRNGALDQCAGNERACGIVNKDDARSVIA